VVATDGFALAGAIAGLLEVRHQYLSLVGKGKGWPT
jgi:hypothetical protein